MAIEKKMNGSYRSRFGTLRHRRKQRYFDELGSRHRDRSVRASSYSYSGVRAGPSHLVLCPTLAPDNRADTDVNKRDLMLHADTLSERLRRKGRRRVDVVYVDHKEPRLRNVMRLRSANKIYVVGHCNGETMGSKNSGFIDFDPKRLAQWLVDTHLIRFGVVVKLMACYTASIVSKGHIPFAKQVSQALAELGYKGVTVRGYNGRTKESMLAGRYKTVCTPFWSQNQARSREGDVSASAQVAVPIAASKAAIDYRA